MFLCLNQRVEVFGCCKVTKLNLEIVAELQTTVLYEQFLFLYFQQFGLGGDPEASRGHDKTKVLTMQRVDDREIKVTFDADKHTAMKWNFRPQQRTVTVIN